MKISGSNNIFLTIIIIKYVSRKYSNSIMNEMRKIINDFGKHRFKKARVLKKYFIIVFISKII